MVCLDLRSGRRLWEREVGGSETPWLAGDWLFVQTLDQSLQDLVRRGLVSASEARTHAASKEQFAA